MTVVASTRHLAHATACTTTVGSACASAFRLADAMSAKDFGRHRCRPISSLLRHRVELECRVFGPTTSLAPRAAISELRYRRRHSPFAIGRTVDRFGVGGVNTEYLAG